MPPLASLHVRRADTRDFKHVAKLFWEFQHIHHQALPQVFKHPDTIPFTQGIFQEILKTPDRAFFVADYGSPIGIALITAIPVPVGDLQFPRTVATLEIVYVKEKYRGRGVARALLKACYQWAREQGFDWIATDVWTFSQDALQLFQREGFEMRSHRLSKSLQ